MIMKDLTFNILSISASILRESRLEKNINRIDPYRNKAALLNFELKYVAIEVTFLCVRNSPFVTLAFICKSCYEKEKLTFLMLK